MHASSPWEASANLGGAWGTARVVGQSVGGISPTTTVADAGTVLAVSPSVSAAYQPCERGLAMSTEHEPYYQSDAFLGYVPIKEWEFGVHLRVHAAREPYREPQALFPLTRTRGERTYVLAKPYLLHPGFRRTVTR